MMIIAHISDIHIKAGSSALGTENVGRLALVLERLAQVAPTPDLLVISGDLAEEGDLASYRVLRGLLEPVPIPMLLAVGNHDRRDAFRTAFPDTPVQDGFVQYAVDIGKRRIIVLDTLEEGRDGGAFCAIRAEWLRTTLAEKPNTETLIVLHHPPAATGIDWMDMHPAEAWATTLGDIIRPHPQVVALIAGHVHRAIAMQWEHRALTVISSTAPQVALDLRPIDGQQPDDRPLIVAEPPGLALHRWTDDGLFVSHFDTASEPRTIARFDEQHQPMIIELTKKNG